MKRDWDLIRVILAHVESETLPEFLADLENQKTWIEGQFFSDYMKNVDEKKKAERIINEHLKLLIDGGYVEGIYVTKGAGCFYQVSIDDPCLTNQGHDLLQAIRSEGLWPKVKSCAKSLGVEISMQTLKGLIPYALKKMTE